MTDSQQIAVIDTQIQGYQTLQLAAEEAGLEVILLSGDGDGFEELAEELEDREGIEALHILSHGASGQVFLGDDVLSSDSLDDHSEALAIISGALSEEGDLLLYGCNVALGERGEAFVEELALVTGADVAASDDVTGKDELGGNWNLEHSNGLVRANSFSLLDFGSTLGTLTFDNAPRIYSSDASEASGTYGIFTITVHDSHPVLPWPDFQKLTSDQNGMTAPFAVFLGSGTGNSGYYRYVEFELTDGSLFTPTSIDMSLNTHVNVPIHSVFIKAFDGSGAQVGSHEFTNKGESKWTITFANYTGFGSIDTLRIGIPTSNGLLDNFAYIAGGGNTAPSFTSGTSFSINETATNDPSVLLDVQANDGDGGASDATVTYSIVGGTGQALFSVDSDDGEIRLNATGASTLDYESATSYTLTVRADDGATSNNTTDQSITVNINDIAPVITSGQSFGVNESDANSTSLGTVVTSGDDDSVTFSIQSGNTGNAFAINGSIGQITLNDTTQLDASATPSYSLTVRADDGNNGSQYSEQTVTINVTDDVAPSVTASAPSGSPAATAASVDFAVTFDESVTGVSTDDFQLIATGSASGSIASISGSGSSYTVTVNSISGEGTLRLDLKANTNIVDAAGNGNNTNGYVAAYTSGTAHTVDRVDPTFNAAGSTPADDGLVTNLSNDLSLKFSENIALGTGNIVLKDLTNNSTVETFDAATGTGDAGGSISVATDTLTVNPNANLTGGTNYAIQIVATAITDTAGNAFAGIADDTSYNFATVPLVELSVDNATIAEAGGVASYTLSLKDSAGNAYNAPGDVNVTVIVQTPHSD